ncbi:type II toxin-antitoxin system HicB family antitoxin [Petrimonas sp.]|uniref:type II toxin-antitoxin system HicB family antitoxin n=1 Tax=Petrimonas sp. TaxID=2023866 RepID=UPI003F50E9E2
MDKLKYKGYTGSVEYSEESDCLFGKVLGLKNHSITYEGDTLAELKEDFRTGVDSYLQLCEQKGWKPVIPYSGTLNVRLTPQIHARIAALAEQAGVSLNAFIKETLTKAIM